MAKNIAIAVVLILSIAVSVLVNDSALAVTCCLGYLFTKLENYPQLFVR